MMPNYARYLSTHADGFSPEVKRAAMEYIRNNSPKATCKGVSDTVGISPEDARMLIFGLRSRGFIRKTGKGDGNGRHSNTWEAIN